MFPNDDETQGYQNLTGNDFFPRMQQIYDPSNFGVNMPQNDPDIMELINKLYQPKEDLHKLYMEQLQNIPQREKPSKLRQVGAALSGLSTMGPASFENGQAVGIRDYNPALSQRISSDFLNKPYNQKVEDWKLKTGVLQKGAAEEEKENVNKRILAEQTSQRIINQGRAKIAEKEQQSKEAKRNADIEATNTRLQNQMQVASDKLEQAQRMLDEKGRTADNLLKLNEAKLNAEIAKWNLDRAQKDKQLEEMKSLHENLKNKWETERKDYEARTDLWKQYNADRLAGKDTTRYEFDKDGNITKKVETKSVQNKTPNAANPINKPSTIRMKGPDGKVYNIPSDKVEDAKKNRMVVVE